MGFPQAYLTINRMGLTRLTVTYYCTSPRLSLIILSMNLGKDKNKEKRKPFNKHLTFKNVPSMFLNKFICDLSNFYSHIIRCSILVRININK